jgi:hypothetical protein
MLYKDNKYTKHRALTKFKYGCIAVSLVLAGMVAQATWAVSARFDDANTEHDWNQTVYLHTLRSLTQFDATATPAGAVKVAQSLRQALIVHESRTPVLAYPAAEDFTNDIKQMDFLAILGAVPRRQCAPQDIVICWVDALNTEGIAPDKAAVERMATEIRERKLIAKMAGYSAALHGHNLDAASPFGFGFIKHHPALHQMNAIGVRIVLAARQISGKDI